MTPLAIDLYAGVGGWTDGLLAEGYECVGFDIERHVYGEHRYPAQLVLQDVLTLHGSQFRDAALIVASPPCQAYSYRAMPWKRAKALPPPDNTLFDACFRIQREAIAAAGHFIPLVVENVCGAQKWVGRAKWHYGSFYLWGDVPALMPITMKRFHKIDSPHLWLRDPRRAGGKYAPDYTKTASVEGVKVASEAGCRTDIGNGARFTSRDCGREAIKNTGGSWFAVANNTRSGKGRNPDGRLNGTARKAASALIAKIPLELSTWIGKAWHP